MKEELISLLEKYYRGETSPEEEKWLKEEILSENNPSSEQDFFAYCASESRIPADLEEHIFSGLKNNAGKRKLRIRIYQLTTIAATFTLIIYLYMGYRTGLKNERDFRMIEQALYHVSETLQPEPEEPEMLVLWVDNNVEIIVN